MSKQARNKSGDYRLKLSQAIRFGICICFLMPFTSVVSANQVNSKPALQDTAEIRSRVNEFLQIQTRGLPGKVAISIGHIDQHIRLQPCAALQTFLPTGSRAWGRTTVGVRCTMPGSWTIYVQARVTVSGEYLAAASPLRQGHVLGEQDLMFLTGDLTTLPPNILTDKTFAIGQTLSSSISAGTVLRQDILRKPLAVKQGQAVRIVSTGKGFTVSAEGQALASANEGQMVRAKTGNGSVVSGIARDNGEIVVSF